MSWSVYFMFLIPIQTLSSICLINTVSNTYQIHIHYRYNSYQLHVLLSQNDLLSVFSAFSPNPDYIIHLFHWSCIKNISNSYTLQIKFTSFTYSVVPKWAALWIFRFSPNPFFIIHLFHWNCIKYISNSYPLHIKFILITYSVIPKWVALYIFCFSSKSRLYHTSISLKLYQIHIKFVSIKMSSSVDFCFFGAKASLGPQDVKLKANKNDYHRISSGHIIQFGECQDIILFYFILFHFISFYFILTW